MKNNCKGCRRVEFMTCSFSQMYFTCPCKTCLVKVVCTKNDMAHEVVSCKPFSIHLLKALDQIRMQTSMGRGNTKGKS